MNGKNVFVLSCNTGVLGVFTSQKQANEAKRDYQSYIKRLKVEEFTIY